MAIMSAQVTAIPGAAEHVHHGCEFFREQEEAAIGDGLLIADCVEDGAGEVNWK